MATIDDALTGQTVELLQQLIRNQCVNDGTIGSGHEVRTSDVLRTYLAGTGLDIEVYEPEGAPGRTSLVARVEGSDPAAPTLCLMGHTDVVPVTPQHWTRDPFGGELVNGEVWGRGAVDMLNLTASQAVARVEEDENEPHQGDLEDDERQSHHAIPLTTGYTRQSGIRVERSRQ